MRDDTWELAEAVRALAMAVRMLAEMQRDDDAKDLASHAQVIARRVQERLPVTTPREDRS